MSVTTTTNRVNYTGDSATVTFAFTYPVYQLGDLQVWTDDTGTNTNAPEGLVLRVLNGTGGFDYTQSKVNFPGGVKGGSITFNLAPFTDMKVILLRVVSETQTAKYGNFDKWDAKSGIEQSFDLLEMQVQQMKRELDASLGIAIDASSTDPTLPRVPGADICESVQLHLHLDGASGSTVYTDSSRNNIAVNGSGTTTIATTQSKFGGSSLHVFPSNMEAGPGWIETAELSTLGVGDKDFTMEAWGWLDPNPVYNVADFSTFRRHSIIGFTNDPNDSTQWIELRVATDSSFTNTEPMWFARVVDQISGFDNVNIKTVIKTNEWHHYAMSRKRNGDNTDTFRLFLDGIIQWTNTRAHVTYRASSRVFIGGNSGSAPGDGRLWFGYIDEARLVIGSAVYTANFTPPFNAFANCGPATPTTNLIGVNSTGTGLKVLNIPAGTRSYTFGASLSSRLVTFTVPGTYTWTVPAGVTKLYIEIAGSSGGGGGGGIRNGSDALFGARGENGSDGGWAELLTTAITPGEIIDIVIGAPGTAGARGTVNNGGRGGNAALTTIARRAPNAGDTAGTLNGVAQGGFGGSQGPPSGNLRSGGVATGASWPDGGKMLGTGAWDLGMTPGAGYLRLLGGPRGGQGGNGGYSVTNREIQLGEDNLLDLGLLRAPTDGIAGNPGYVAIYY